MKEELKKVLTDIMQYQMDYVQLARTTEPYKLAEKGLKILSENKCNEETVVYIRVPASEAPKYNGNYYVRGLKGPEVYRYDIYRNKWYDNFGETVPAEWLKETSLSSLLQEGAVDFSEWLMDNNYQGSGYINGSKVYSQRHKTKSEYYELSELYNKFIEEKYGK